MIKQYLVGVQQKWQRKDGSYSNLSMLMREGFKRYYTDLEEAKQDLKKYIEMNNRGERTETTYFGGIGIETVIDAETASNQAVVDWYIKVREVTPWELIEKM